MCVFCVQVCMNVLCGFMLLCRIFMCSSIFSLCDHACVCTFMHVSVSMCVFICSCLYVHTCMYLCFVFVSLITHQTEKVSRGNELTLGNSPVTLAGSLALP